MKKSKAFVALMVLSLSFFFNHSMTFAGTPIPSYYAQKEFLMAPASTFMDGLVGFANPANLALIKSFESGFHWSTDGPNSGTFANWGLFTGARGLGFSVLSQKINASRVNDYRIISGFGNQELAIGLTYGWSTGLYDALGREKQISTGMIYRPSKYVSVGLTGNFSVESDAREGVAEFGFRPFGNAGLVLFADMAMQKQTQLSQAPWSAGAAAQLIPGIYLVGRAFDQKTYTVGLSVNLGQEGLGAQTFLNSKAKNQRQSFMLRFGDMQPSFYPARFEKDKNYLQMNLKGRVDYQKFILFDENTHRLKDILTDIRAASQDERIGAIVLNLSGMQIAPENAWEIREALKQARQAGKKVITFIDNCGLTDYHLASVADKVVLDPQGAVQLPGFTLGRTYLKGTLEKLGLGYDEWRFFKYKSATETLSREQMSDADREQYQNYLDSWYETVRADICQSRGLSNQEFDRLVDEQMYYMPEPARQSGLVDTLARWSDLEEIVQALTKKDLESLAARDLMANAQTQQTWGELPQIALVYGLGVCDLDEGIQARWLERLLLDLAGKASVKAIVFRVDSPGGDGMASDLVAEALKKCSQSKPVIVSQGQVAGSGGYWISMYADTIVAGPNTITGSIGVIGGWIYDKGLSTKLGLTSDHVKRGAHADLGYGVTLPLLGLRIPERNLTEDERARMEDLIKKFYDVFVTKVAQGRNLPVEEVRKIAEGHFYSGLDGKAIKLVDEIGGMQTALAIACQKAGLSPEAEFKIVEYPQSKGLFNIPSFNVQINTELLDPNIGQYLKMFQKNTGQALPMMLPGTYPVPE